jgi:hypothetical protein
MLEVLVRPQNSSLTTKNSGASAHAGDVGHR